MPELQAVTGQLYIVDGVMQTVDANTAVPGQVLTYTVAVTMGTQPVN